MPINTKSLKQGFSSLKLLVAISSLIAIGLLVGLISWRNFHPPQNSNDAIINSNNPKVAIPSAKRYWIIGTPALNEIVTSSSARQTLASDTIFVPINKKERIAPQANGLHIVPVESFTSEAALANAVSSNSIDKSVKVLLYDNEDWTLTPIQEQQNIVSYYKQAASIAHKYGYLLIGTPVSKTDPQVDVQIAPYVDVLDIQSQYDQAQARIYANHVLPLAQGARKTNANLIILSGLSTNPPAGIPTPQQLLNDSQSVSSVVQGFWLNIPSPGVACPKCNAPQPQIGIEFLDMLANH